MNYISGCPVYSYASAADAAALDQHGVSVSGYQHRIYIMANGSSGCNWLALGVVGGYGSTGTLRSWSRILDASALAHEVGHNVGWHHAATDTNNNGYNASESTDVEYGDTSGTMGYCCTEKKFNAVHMDQIGWYDNQPAGTMLTVAGGDNYTLVPLGTDPNSATGPQILKVSKPDTGEVYYLSYRQKIGGDINLSTAYTNGLNIHHGSETGIWSYFIKALSDGEVFDDPTNGLSIVQNSHNTNGVNITISYDSCLTTNPSVSVAPTPQTVDLLAPPASMAYNVTVSNNDSLGCDPASFQLTTDLGTLANSTGLVSPGTSSSQLQLTIADTEIIGLNDGDNIFTVDADRGANSGAGAGNLIGDGQPPTEPSSPAAVKKKVKGQQSVQVSWGASTDAGTGVSFYRIRRGIAGANFVEMATTSSLKYVDTSASVDNSYDYTIEAYDAYNHASTAAQVTYTPGGGGGPRKR